MSHNPAVIKSKEKDKAALAFSMYFRITIQQRKRASPHIKVKNKRLHMVKHGLVVLLI